MLKNLESIPVRFAVRFFFKAKLISGDDITKKTLTNMSLTDFVTRLLKKRCVSFVGQSDAYLLLSGKQGTNCYKNKETVSSKDLISYDEVKVLNPPA